MLANRAFTLLESLIALSLAALVMITIQFLIPHLNQVIQPDDRTTFQTALHQLEIQKYSVKDNNNHVINMMSADSKKMTLMLRNNKLQLSAAGSGQIILMENVDDLIIMASGSLFKLTIKIHHRTIHGILYLQKVATS
ncbi:prepilin-type N-terminal cleavage/methylation domain-containing protein [Leuconostoc pseudomesenteroides]|uniref:prepilin-type N-terminal cleavage/methylation domain-containing protein n=1 Tax=Leuconostoc pseudomesenteroides TaxID=33968 RepID=UPI0021AA6F8C|nr:prepilin-type N-terminal cleavage/methylation domain-containing protein [Leuconostoc pseudomesenteroides]MCT4387237.1 prepilin-type N-terminal cleavage/methylation domain-containing protein [Leuconostoc pseudomesenteroides]